MASAPVPGPPAPPAVMPAWRLLARLVIDHLPTLLIAGLVAVPILDRVLAADRARSAPRVDYQVVPVPADVTPSPDVDVRRTGRVRVRAPAPTPQSRPAPAVEAQAPPRPEVGAPPPAAPPPSSEGIVDQVLGSVP